MHCPFVDHKWNNPNHCAARHTIASSHFAIMPRFAYVSAYCPPDGHGKGITVYDVDTSNGKLNKPIQTVDTASPSFLCLNRHRTRLYAVNELNEFKGQTGTVSSFIVDGTTGQLSPLNCVSTDGYLPCHIILDPSEEHLLVANYGTGSVAVFPLGEDGSVKPHSQLVQHSGNCGPHLSRQEGPHAHMVCFDVSGTNVTVCDLGLDKVLAYKYGDGRLVADTDKVYQVDPGAGPRHLVESNDGRFCYVICELNNSISVFTSGETKRLQVVSTLPEGVHGDGACHFGCAEIALHPNGKYLYVSNRGHDSIAIYAVDTHTGLLTLKEWQKTLGECPRHFALDSQGKVLYALNQRSDNIWTFNVDPTSGRLTAADSTETPSPNCIVFY